MESAWRPEVMKARQVNPIRRILLFFWKNYSKAILIGAFAIVLIDAAELILPLLIRDAVDSFSEGVLSLQKRNRLIQGLGAVVFLQIIGRYVWRVALSKSAMLAGAEFRKKLAEKSFQISFLKMEKYKVGDLMTLATSDVENVRFALGPGVIALIDAGFYLISLPIAMFLIAPALAWKILIPVALIPWVVLVFQGRISIQSKIVQEQIGRLGTLTQEMIAGIRLIKINGMETLIRKKLSDESHQLNAKMVELTQNQARLNPGMEFFLSTSMVLLFSSTEFSIGTLVAMQRYLQKLLWPLSASALAVIYFQKAKASGEEIFRYLDETDVEEGQTHTRTEKNVLQPKPDQPIIEAKKLNFSFVSSKPILKNLTIKIYPGEWVGIAGPVGSGKSTFLELLLKFYPVERGALFVNGVDLSELSPAEVRTCFSTVMQDPYLFQGTLLENLNIGEESEPLSWTMNVSGMYDDEFQHRLEQKIGERGVGLSGGQKQRVAIARALRKKSPVLLLDDPLSSVDSKTAEHVLKQMSHEIRKLNKTVVMVSHHPEHLRYCDRVVNL
jgi:ATP-binding cassette subfamily B multidrug efflux pump